MDDAIRYAGAAELRARYAGGEVSPTEVVRATLDLLAERQDLHAFVTVTDERALEQAAAAERRIRSLGARAWEGRPLLGVPVSVKDLIPTAGIRTTRGSLRHERWVPDADAPAVARLLRAGAVLIGKTTTSEFGWSAGSLSLLGPGAANPWDPRRSAGGSSGGAAAAVAAGIGAGALGTDGAGSIRVPAAFCGTVGFKPTFGRVPYVPFSPEGLSHVGPLTRDVATAKLMTDVIAGAHRDDPLSADRGGPPPVREGRARIAWLRWEVATSDVESVARAAANALDGELTELDVPFDDPYPELVTILTAFDAAGQSPADDALSDPARLRLVEYGRRLSAAELAQALAARVRFTSTVDRVMERFDALAMPTVSIEPFDVDAWRPGPPAAGDDRGWLAWCRTTYPFNLTGQPAISVPAGFTAAGYPVGLQLVGRRGEDDLLLDLAACFERARPWSHAYSRKDDRSPCQATTT